MLSTQCEKENERRCSDYALETMAKECRKRRREKVRQQQKLPTMLFIIGKLTENYGYQDNKLPGHAFNDLISLFGIMLLTLSLPFCFQAEIRE